MTRGDTHLRSSESGGSGDDHSLPDAHEDSPRVQNVNSLNADKIDPTASSQPITRTRMPFVASLPICGQDNSASSSHLQAAHADTTPANQGVSMSLSHNDHEGNVNSTYTHDSQGIMDVSTNCPETARRRDSSELGTAHETRFPGGQVGPRIGVVLALVILTSSYSTKLRARADDSDEQGVVQYL
jgi:hypothetical protein